MPATERPTPARFSRRHHATLPERPSRCCLTDAQVLRGSDAHVISKIECATLARQRGLWHGCTFGSSDAECYDIGDRRVCRRTRTDGPITCRKVRFATREDDETKEPSSTREDDETRKSSTREDDETRKSSSTHHGRSHHPRRTRANGESAASASRADEGPPIEQ